MVTVIDYIELNIVYYLCFFRNALPLNVTSCSPEQQSILYMISNASFSSLRDNTSLYYNLITPTLGKNACYFTTTDFFLSLIIFLSNILFFFVLCQVEHPCQI